MDIILCCSDPSVLSVVLADVLGTVAEQELEVVCALALAVTPGLEVEEAEIASGIAHLHALGAPRPGK